MKRTIAILCLVALFLSTSVATYFYWIQEQWHESKVFAKIEAGAFESFENQIKITVQDKAVLPEGYEWEEKGREFTHKGMFYDIISIKKTETGWLITAASDEAEAEWEANAQKLHTEGEGKEQHNNKSKLNISKVVYDSPKTETVTFSVIIQKLAFCFYPSYIHAVYLGQMSPPPKFA